jgi:hypothetical protein
MEWMRHGEIQAAPVKYWVAFTSSPIFLDDVAMFATEGLLPHLGFEGWALED